MKPEQCQEQLITQHPAADAAHRAAVRDFAEQRLRVPIPEPTESFEAILEAYARDPERWDGLE